MTKFKVGDKVKINTKNLVTVNGEYVVIEKKFSGYPGFDDILTVIETKNVGGSNDIKHSWNTYCISSLGKEKVWFSENELLTVNEQPDSSENKVGKIMNNIKSFVKNSFLTSDEKLLRKYGFKNDCGDYTQDAKDYAIIRLCTEKEADMIKVAQGLDDEAKASK